jgi:lipid-A-disaccharide synthase
MTEAALRVAMVAGEPSGDILGARVIGALRAALGGRELRVEGVGGPAMEAQGCKSHYSLERLSVMGLVEPLARLPELLRMRGDLVARYAADPPDFFLGIDAPDFNLNLERRLRKRGVRTAHLVSPTVWAWRPGRVHTVARSVERVLCLFPFEPPLYADSGVVADFVGHPMVAELQGLPDREAARRELGLDPAVPVIALLPGSRQSEVAQIGDTLLAAAQLLRSRDPRRVLLLPTASHARYEQCAALLRDHPGGSAVQLVQGQSRTAMIAADVVLLASGTASLEAMLLERPMVIAYRLAALTWSLTSRLAVTPWVGLPNILAGREVVPELLQDDLTPSALAIAAEEQLAAPQRQLTAFRELRSALDIDFDAAVATALGNLYASG